MIAEHIRRAVPLLSTLMLLAAPALTAQQDVVVPAQKQISAWARRIDQLLDDELKRQGQRANPAADDEILVRRIYLTLIGRIPTADEARAFLDDRRRGRREDLIDRLLDSPGHLSHEIHFWADLFRAKARLQRQISGEPFLHFLKDSLARNVSYDDLVRQMLVADGPAHARDHGATGYLLRDLGMPEDSMANTVRVFLGTRMECAQCHDHPFDKWTQRQFYEMTAFGGGTRYRAADLLQGPRGNELRQFGRELRGNDPDRSQTRALRRITQSMTVGLGGGGTGVIRLPEDFQGQDGQPGSFVEAEVIFGQQPELAEPQPLRPPGRRDRRSARDRPTHRDIGSREAFAEWLTSPTNPRFTRVIVNRMWQRAFGVALIEPIDDMRDDSQAAQPALMNYLEALMRELDYDLLQFQRVMYYTDAWRRQAAVATEGEPFLFQGPALRRLSAEQLWDSLLTLTIEDVDGSLKPIDARAEPIYAQFDELAQMDIDQLRANVEKQSLRYSDPDKFRKLMQEERAERRRQQAMEREGIDAIRQQLREAQAELRRARQRGQTQRVEVLQRQIEELRATARRNSPNVARASDLPSPTPPGHFLREFGQSDREQIEGAFDDATVPQALELMNGIVQSQVASPGSYLSRQLAQLDDPADCVRAAFLAILTREPGTAELRRWISELEENRKRALNDLIWTLCNSHEFRFLQ